MAPSPTLGRLPCPPKHYPIDWILDFLKQLLFFFFFFFNFWLCWVFIGAQGLSLGAANRGHSLVVVLRLLLVVASLAGQHRL